MQQDNNHIENNLRQLENKQLPDLSQMDAHWQQMQAVLAPDAITPQKKSFFNDTVKKLLFAAGIIAIALVAYFVNFKNNADHKNEWVNNTEAEKANVKQPATQPFDTAAKKITPVTAANIPARQMQHKANSIFATGDSLAPDTAVTPDFFNDMTAVANDNKMSLDNFYSIIKKPVQEFIIEAAKGGEINCNAGTKFSIPPAAFYDANGKLASGEIKICVEEFYSYADMIAANLVTMSDGNQLVTGGMVKITASKDSVELELRNNKTINLSMPARYYDAEMELFYGEKNTGNVKYAVNAEQATASYRKRVNWRVAGLQNRYPAFDGKTNVMVFDDKPYKVHNTFRVIGKFNIPLESPYTEDEAKAILQEKYGGYYDKIKVRKVNKNFVRHGLFGKRVTYDPRIVTGDSIRMTVAEALRLGHIQKADSLFYAKKTIADSLLFVKKIYSQRFNGNLTNPVWVLNLNRDTIAGMEYRIDSKINSDSLQKLYEARIKTEERYNFTVKNMGWINCDKFYRYDNKTDFVLNLPADVEADKFVTQIVFTSIRSVMPGQFYKNKIGFMNIPANMPVYVVGLGERNGKVVSFMQPLKTSANDVSITSLDETTPEAFKEKLKQLDL
ncbi:hypothetical protein [Ferruginibacter profundus]